MSQVARYIFRQAALALVAISLALTAAIWLAYSVRFIDFIVNRGLPLSTFLYLITLSLPRFFAIALPIALFCAVLFVFHRLVTDSELVVLRATGISDARLTRPAVALALVVAGIVGALNLHLAPLTERSFKDLQFAIRNDFASLVLQPGVFKPLGNGMTVYVQELGDPGQFRGILIHDNKDPSRRVTVMAEQGATLVSPGGPRIVLVHGNRQEFEPASGKLSVLHFDKYTVDLGFIGEMRERWRDTNERSLTELLTADARYGQRNVAKFRAEAHERIASVFYGPSLTAIALLAVLGGHAGRRGYARRILAGAGAALAVLAGALWLKGVAAKSPAVTPLLYVVVAMPVLAGLLWAYAPRRWLRRMSDAAAALRPAAAGVPARP